MINIPGKIRFSKILSFVAASVLLAHSFAAYAGDVGTCGQERCLLIGKFKPGLLPQDGANGAGNDHMIVFEGGVWKYDGQVLASFGMGSWQPLLGDWDGDGFDELGVYSNGLFALKHTWETMFGGITLVNLGSTDAQPVIGDWNGDGTDGIGTYDQGKFELIDDYNDPVVDRFIDFGTIPPDTQVLPVVGPLGQVQDLVGLLAENTLQHTATNLSATYDFFSHNDPWLARSSVLVESEFLRPLVVDADLLKVPGRTGMILGLMYVPGSEPISGFSCTPSTNCYFLNPVHGQLDNSTALPDTEGGIVIPRDR